MRVWVGWLVLYVIYIIYTMCTIGFLVMFWREVYPKLKDILASPPGRLLVLGLKGLAGLLAYILARGWLMLLTGVEPTNFPRALVVFGGIALFIIWPMLITCGAVLLVMVYIGPKPTLKP